MKNITTFVYIASCIAMFAVLFDILTYGITMLSINIVGSIALFLVLYTINRMSDARLSREENKAN